MPITRFRWPTEPGLTHLNLTVTEGFLILKAAMSKIGGQQESLTNQAD